MISGMSSQFTTMLAGSDQTAEWRVWIDIPEYDAVLDADEIQIDAGMTTDMPDQSRLLEGYPTMEATFTLAGLVDKSDETKTIAWLLGRYSTTSPLWGTDVNGRDVTVELWGYPEGCEGVPEKVRKFTGTVDTYTQAGGAVQFSCLDNRSKLRAVPKTPPAITAAPYNAGLTPEYAIDAVLRAATNGATSSWPATRPGCLLAVGYRTSLWPEVGTYEANNSQYPPLFAPGAFGSGLAEAFGGDEFTPAQEVTYSLTSALGSGQDFTIEFWVTRMASTTGTVSVGVRSDAGSAWVALDADPAINDIEVYTNTSSGQPLYSVPVAWDDASHFVACHFHIIAGGQTSFTVRLDGTTYASGSVSSQGSPFGTTGFTQAAVSLGGNGTENPVVNGLLIHQESSPVWNDTFSPTAILDSSKNSLQVVPGYSGDPWQVIQQIAAAENGYAGFDEDGLTFRFLNRDTLANRALAATVTSEDALASLEIESSAASVINRAQIGFTPWEYAQKRSTIYSPAIPRSVPPRSSQTFKVKLDTYAVDIDTAPSLLPANQTDGTGNPTDRTKSWYRASTDRNGVNTYTGTLTWGFDQLAPDHLEITVTNPSSARVWFVSPASYTEADMPAGIPSLWIAGKAVTPQSEEVADYQYPSADYVWPDGRTGAAGSRFGEIPYQATGNPWSQDPDSAAELAQDVVLAQWTPKPNLLSVYIKPNPLLQRADLVRIVDNTTTGVDEYALIFGWTITWKAADNGTADYTMTVDARTIASPRAWIAGVAGRSEAGVTTYAVAG